MNCEIKLKLGDKVKYVFFFAEYLHTAAYDLHMTNEK